MQFFKAIPPGLWVIKWIDRFYLGRGEAESPFVHVALQKLPFDDISIATRLSRDDTAYALGKRPGAGPQDPPEYWTERVLAGYLPLLRIGDITRGGAIVGKLRSARATVTVNDADEVKTLRVGDVVPHPKDWSAGVYRLLNRFDFHLGGIPDIYKSECLVIRQQDTDFIIPKMVIFQTFYGFHTNLINALCGGYWRLNAHKVISFDNFESGLRTEIDESSGAWKIVLQPGIRPDLAPAIALLWFDPFARAAVDSLYTSALAQNSGVRSGDTQSWFTNAVIPHRMDKARPFQMDLLGFPLRPFMPSAAGNEPKKFLVHSIVRSSWSLPDQEIFLEMANSNAKGEKQSPTSEPRPYGGKRPVEANPDAIATSDEDPDAGSAVNMAFSSTFEFINKPEVRKQAKASSKIYPGVTSAVQEEADSIISSGNSVHGEGRPSIAQAEQRVRKPSQLFHHLVEALNELANNGAIDSFEAVAPPGDAGLLIVRNGLSCWSLLRPSDREARRVPKTGWEVIHDSQTIAGMEVPRRYARCLLILRIVLNGRALNLFEIEPRPGEGNYCMYAFEQGEELMPWYIEHVIAELRAQEGRLTESALARVFQSLTNNPVKALKHAFRYPPGKNQENSDPIGLKVHCLAGALERALAPLEKSLP